LELQESTIRRPIASRHSTWAIATAGWLGRRGLRPNQISLLSVVFAGLAGLCLVLAATSTPAWRIVLLLIAAACLPLRLLCNLFDGMLAVEGGLRSAVGELYNELPDRLADLLILVGAGYSGAAFDWAHELGWVAGVLAVMTAYVRTLGQAAGAAQHFFGPMAKPQRMHVMIAACVLAACETAVGGAQWVMPAALLIVIAGTIVTIARRLRRIARDLETR